MASFTNVNSARYRAQGNELFTSASEAGKHNVWKMRQLEESIKAYERGKVAAQQEKNPLEWLRNERSIGVASSKLACTESFQEINEKEWVIFQFKRSISSFCSVLSNVSQSDAGLGPEWIQGVMQKLSEMIEPVKAFGSNSSSWNQRVGFLESMKSLRSEANEAASLWHLLVNVTIAEEIKKVVIVADEKDEWRMCLSAIEDINRPLAEARQLMERVRALFPLYDFGELQIQSTLLELEQDRMFYSSRARSAQLRAQGERATSALFFEEEALDTDLLWFAIDSFSAAVAALRVDGDIDEGDANYHCHESVARTSSSLGLLFDKAAKMEDKAHQYYLRCIQHADIVTHQSGATFFNQTFYQTAKTGIEAHRKRKREQEEKAREPILDRIKQQLDGIKAAMATYESRKYKAFALLQHIYVAVPPKRENSKLKEGLDKDDDKAMKNAVMTAIRHYHPDKNQAGEFGIDWQTLCEEITARLNSVYEAWK